MRIDVHPPLNFPWQSPIPGVLRRSPGRLDSIRILFGAQSQCGLRGGGAGCRDHARKQGRRGERENCDQHYRDGSGFDLEEVACEGARAEENRRDTDGQTDSGLTHGAAHDHADDAGTGTHRGSAERQ